MEKLLRRFARRKWQRVQSTDGLFGVVPTPSILQGVSNATQATEKTGPGEFKGIQELSKLGGVLLFPGMVRLVQCAIVGDLD